MVYRDREYFGAKSKDYDAIIKRAVKEHHLGISDVLETRGSAQKELQGNEFMQSLKKYTKQEKFLSLLFKE